MKKKLISLSLTLVMALSLTACGNQAASAPPKAEATTPAANNAPGAEGKKYNFVFAICDKQTTTAVITEKRMKELDAQMDNVEITYMANSNSDANVAIENARNVITLKPDIYINYLVNKVSDTVGQMMEEANQPMLSVQSRCGDTPLCAIDNITIGHDMAEALVKYYKENWANEKNVEIVFANMPDSGQMFVDRQTGGEEYFKKEVPSMTQSLINGHGDMEKNRQMFADYLTAHPDSKVLVWAHIDEPAFGILAAAQAAGRTDDVVIVSTGGIADFYKEMQKEGSSLLGTVDYFPEKWADITLKVAMDMVDGKEVPEKTVFESVLVTKENIAQLRPEHAVK